MQIGMEFIDQVQNEVAAVVPVLIRFYVNGMCCFNSRILLTL